MLQMMLKQVVFVFQINTGKPVYKDQTWTIWEVIFFVTGSPFQQVTLFALKFYLNG